MCSHSEIQSFPPTGFITGEVNLRDIEDYVKTIPKAPEEYAEM